MKSKDQGLVVLGVNREEDAAKVEAFVAEQRLTYPVFLDPQRAFYSRFAGGGVPWNVVLDPQLRVCWSAPGFDEAALRRVVDEELARLR